MNSLKNFLYSKKKPNLVLSADCYTICGDCLVSEESKQYSCYNIINRYSPMQAWTDIAKDSRMSLWGLSHFIKHYLTEPVTIDDINAADCFLSQANVLGGGLKFNRKIWERIVTEHDGYLPIRITALPEASTFFPNEPVVAVESVGSGFGEIAAHIESLMLGMVSIGSAAVTLRLHWMERLIEWLKLDKTDSKTYDIVQNYIHDFSMRACSCGEESELLGSSHLLVFRTTDTMYPAYNCWLNGAKNDTGKSILALAHRTVSGYSTEKECYENLMQQDKIGSYVADCYNFANAVNNILVPMAINNPEKIVVIRADSGDHIENTKIVIDAIRNNGNPSNVKRSHGDSINPTLMKNIIEYTWESGIDPTQFLVFGVGGWWVNKISRDSLSSSYKLCCVGKDYRPVVKLSEVQGKMSVPGPNHITRDWSNGHSVEFGHGKDARKVWYDGTEKDPSKRYTELCYEDFSVLQDRCIKQFNEMGKRPYNFGLPECSCLSEKIQSIQQEYKERYK